MVDNEKVPEVVVYRLGEVEKIVHQLDLNVDKLINLINDRENKQIAMEKDIAAVRSEFERYRAGSTRWIVLIVSAMLTPIIIFILSKVTS